MKSFLVGLGGYVLEIRPLYDAIRIICRDYVLPESRDLTPDGVIAVEPAHIDAEIQHAARTEAEQAQYPEEFTRSYYETVAVFRLIADWLSFHDACVFHGVLVELDGEGYLFTAKSGTGKSTHAANWLKMYPSARIINGDKPILRIMDGCLYGYGTPWCGKENIQINTAVPVKAVVYLKRGTHNTIVPIDEATMAPVWITQMHMPEDDGACERAFDTMIEMMSVCDFYKLHCNMDAESALVCREGILAGSGREAEDA